MILPFLYNAPIIWYALLIKYPDQVKLEQFDNYTKQTYRNRCSILGANGKIDLVIPVIKEHGKKTLLKDVRIDYDMDWDKNHWNSIQSAYASAPFYEFMEDSFRLSYEKRFTFLIDLNYSMLESSLKLLNINIELGKSESYQQIELARDFRELIHPKKKFIHPYIHFEAQAYHQVFSQKHGFVGNLSILDLLFNEGPNTSNILHQSIDKPMK